MLSDMLALKESLANKVSELGCIHSNWNRWSNIIHDKSSWKALVDEFVARAVKYQASSFASMPVNLCQAVDSMESLTHKCDKCSLAFKTAKALSQHLRAKHGVKTPWGQFIDRSNSCPHCHLVFSNRCRAIAHLSDSRRNHACRKACLDGSITPIDRTSLGELEEVAKQERANARRDGHTRPIAGARPKKRCE